MSPVVIGHVLPVVLLDTQDPLAQALEEGRGGEAGGERRREDRRGRGGERRKRGMESDKGREREKGNRNRGILSMQILSVHPQVLDFNETCPFSQSN